MSLDASYHRNKNTYEIWGGDPNGVCDIRLFYEMKGVGHAPGVSPVVVIG